MRISLLSHNKPIFVKIGTIPNTEIFLKIIKKSSLRYSGGSIRLLALEFVDSKESVLEKLKLQARKNLAIIKLVNYSVSRISSVLQLMVRIKIKITMPEQMCIFIFIRKIMVVVSSNF